MAKLGTKVQSHLFFWTPSSCNFLTRGRFLGAALSKFADQLDDL